MTLKFKIIMLLMCAHLVFPATDSRAEISIKKPSAVKIQSSWKMLTDTATIKLPKNVKDFDNKQIKELFRRGNPVEISLGYNGNLIKEFTGYITHVSTDAPIEIRCEDEMWLLKQTMVNISQKQTTLPDLLKSIIPSGYLVDAIEANIGTVRYSKYTLAKVLDDIKKEFGFYSYMKGKTLVSGKIYLDDTAINPVQLHIEKNLIKNNLKFKRADDTKVSIRVVSTLKNGDTIEVTVGDEDGEEQQFGYYDIQSKEDLNVIALELLDRLKRDALDGSCTTFGTPSLQHGTPVEMISNKYTETTGVYYVDAVTKDFKSTPEYRQTLELGKKATNG